MEIKPGAYRMRNGKKATVVAVHPNVLIKYRFTGYMEKDPEWLTWASNGRFIEKEEDGHDLIDEWREPRKIEGWVVCFEGFKGFKQCATFYEKKSDAISALVPEKGDWLCYVSGTEGVEP